VTSDQYQSVGVYSSVAGLEHHDADTDRLRSFLRDCVRDEGSCDRASLHAVDRSRVDPGRHSVVTDPRLSSPVRQSVARPHRDLVRRRLATGHWIRPFSSCCWLTN